MGTSVPRFSIPLALDKLNRLQMTHQENYQNEKALPEQTMDTVLSSRRSATVVIEDVSDGEERKVKKEVTGESIKLNLVDENFVTPRPEDLSQAKHSVLTSQGDLSQRGQASTKKHLELPLLKISEHREDDTMKEHVEELLNNQMAVRRSSTRINSLLFEEDSLQIKQEMIRQKQEKQRINMEQRISLKFTAGAPGARRLTRRFTTNANTAPAPVSARNDMS